MSKYRLEVFDNIGAIADREYDSADALRVAFKDFNKAWPERCVGFRVTGPLTEDDVSALVRIDRRNRLRIDIAPTIEGEVSEP